MRPSNLVLLSIALATAAAAETGAPSLKIFGGFAPGLWQAVPLDNDTRAHQSTAPMCLNTPDTLIRDGAGASDGCGYTVVEDVAESATVTYACKTSGAGRTSLKLVGDHYRVEAQGFTNREPFENTSDYRRVGACPTAK